MVYPKTRLFVILAVFILSLLGLVLLMVLDQDDGTGFGVVVTLVGTMGTALLDASAEHHKKRKADKVRDSAQGDDG